MGPLAFQGLYSPDKDEGCDRENLAPYGFGSYLPAMARKLTNPKSWFSKSSTIPLIRLYGPIAPGRGSPLGGKTVAHAPLEKAIEQAFKVKKPPAIALAINSPGGAPGQSSLIARHIRSLADEKEVPVIAFCEDVAASGGYLLACAADEIIVNEYTIIGSIGVISAGFGAHEAIEKLGIERRVHTAGKRKAMLDTFAAENPEDVARLKALQKSIHERFMNWVKTRRGEKLDAEAELFEGDVWVGEEAIALGIADGVGQMREVLKERFGKDIEIKEFGAAPKGLLSRLAGGGAAAGHIGAGASEGLLGGIEERMEWARYGL